VTTWLVLGVLALPPLLAITVARGAMLLPAPMRIRFGVAWLALVAIACLLALGIAMMLSASWKIAVIAIAAYCALKFAITGMIVIQTGRREMSDAQTPGRVFCA
jgi:hypothetical protein